MKKYDVGYIIKPNLDSEQVRKVVDSFNTLFSNFNSTVLELKEDGVKELAYEISSFKNGYYVWLVVNATNEAVKEFQRVVNINENILRYIVVVKE